MTQAAVQLMHDLLTKSAETGKTEFDPFEFLGTPASVLDELERNGYITRANTVRQQVVLTELALCEKADN